MERKTYLERYQVQTDERGEPMVLDRGASSVTLKAQEAVSHEPVVLEVVRPGPLQQVPRDEVEADARAAQQLEHINIAQLRDFGFEGDDIVYVRESLEGSTLDAWVGEHGPLPVAAVMRIALQGVSALGAAAFKSIVHRAIQPASVMIVPGQTAEGDWPLVKILNFGSLAPTFSRNGFTTTGPGELALFASPEQLQGAKPDFRSDIYSLGATLWFLLTGAAPRVGMVQRSRGIPKNVVAIVSRMLAANPEQRPHDPVTLQEEIRACLGRAERRDAIGRRFGLAAKVAKPSVAAAVPAAVGAPVSVVTAAGDSTDSADETEDEPISHLAPTAAGPAGVGRFLLRPLAWAAVLLTIGALAAMILPGAIRTVGKWRAEKEPEPIGVKVGVPDAAANAVAVNPAEANPETQAAAPVDGPPQETAVAAADTAPSVAASPSFPSAGSSDSAAPSAPAVAAAPDTSQTRDSTSTNDGAIPKTAAPVVAALSNPNSSKPMQSPPRTEPTAAQQEAPVVAANTNRSQASSEAEEPAAPAEGPDDSARQAQNNRRQSRAADESEERDVQSDAAVSESAPAKTASASAEGERKTRTASATTSRNRTASRSKQREPDLEVRPALPVTPEDEEALPPVPRGSKRARYLGTTPDGALVFGMPSSSERVFVAPPEYSPRRARRALRDAPPPRAEPVDPAELEELQAVDEDEE